VVGTDAFRGGGICTIEKKEALPGRLGCMNDVKRRGQRRGKKESKKKVLKKDVRARSITEGAPSKMFWERNTGESGK